MSGKAGTVPCIVADHGWRDPLSATIDWGDGSPIESTGGVYEDVRPDATLMFERTHAYGDNGTFRAIVCGRDDDTSVCHSIPISISNAPTATIDRTGAITLGGIPMFLARAGTLLIFVATRSTRAVTT